MTELLLQDLSPLHGSMKDFSCKMNPGLHLVIGHNGAGKSSLLKTIAGALPPAGGSIYYHGISLPKCPDKVLLVPSTPPALPWLNADRLLDFMLSLYPSTRREPSYRDRVLRELQIEHALQAPLGALSSGMAKKILIAAALIAAPAVMLFDEPTNEIDTASCLALTSLLAEYRSSHIMLLATHHPDPFLEMAASTLKLGHTTLLEPRPPRVEPVDPMTS